MSEMMDKFAKRVEKAKANGEKSVMAMKFSGAGYEYRFPKNKAYGVALIKVGWLVGQAASFYEELDKAGYNIKLSKEGIEVIL